MLSFRAVGQRLRQHRKACGLTADRVAADIGVSRALLLRYEAGQIIKVSVLERLAARYGTSTTLLLGLGNEYIMSGIAFFERLQALEQKADHMTVVFGPLAYLLTSDAYDQALKKALGEAPEFEEALHPNELGSLMETLAKRKLAFRTRKPALINLIPVNQLQYYLANGLAMKADLPYTERSARRRQAARELEHLCDLISSPRMAIHIGLTHRPLQTAGFQILRLEDRKLLVLSPFRVGEQPNVRYGVAIVSEDDEALRLHEALAASLWDSALTGPRALNEMQKLLKAHRF